MGIVKALDLVPQSIHLLQAILSHLLQIRALIHRLAAFENGNQQLPGGEIINGLGLPGSFRVKNFHFSGIVHGFIVKTHIVRYGFARIVAIEAVQLLEVGVGNLADILGNLDLGNDGAVVLFHRHQLIHAAEHRLALGGNQALAHAEHIDFCPLMEQVLNQVLIQSIGYGNLALGPACLIQHLPGFPGQVCHVAGVHTDAALGNAQGFEHLVEGPDGIGQTGLEGIVGIHQQCGIVGIELAVGLESLILRVKHLDPGMGHGASCQNAVELV